MLVNASESNAFNFLNREAALHNIRYLRSSALHWQQYMDAIVYVDGETVLSQEGNTQGDPWAMAIYAVGILPLIHRVKADVKQVWYADDATAAGLVGWTSKP